MRISVNIIEPSCNKKKSAKSEALKSADEPLSTLVVNPISFKLRQSLLEPRLEFSLSLTTLPFWPT